MATVKKAKNNGKDFKGRFAEGNKFSKGRPRGSINKFTSLKEAFLEAFEELGGAQGLLEWAKKNLRTQGQFYQMIARMLPSKTDVELNRSIADELEEQMKAFFDEFGVPTVNEFVSMLKEIAQKRKGKHAVLAEATKLVESEDGKK